MRKNEWYKTKAALRCLRRDVKRVSPSSRRYLEEGILVLSRIIPELPNDPLEMGHSESLVIGSRNRMKYHPVPKLP